MVCGRVAISSEVVVSNSCTQSTRSSASLVIKLTNFWIPRLLSFRTFRLVAGLDFYVIFMASETRLYDGAENSGIKLLVSAENSGIELLPKI